MSNAQILLSMVCEQQCPGSVNLTKVLHSMALDNWENISIDLQCFEDAGVDFSQVTSPFQISTTGAESLSFADIIIEPNSAEIATISCQQ